MVSVKIVDSYIVREEKGELYLVKPTNIQVLIFDRSHLSLLSMLLIFGTLKKAILLKENLKLLYWELETWLSC